MKKEFKGKRKPKHSAKKRNGGPNRGKRKFSGNRKRTSSLDPSMLIKKAVQSEESVYQPDRTIQEMPISPHLKSRLQKKGFERPTEIQDKTLERLLEGRNLLGIAQTGTGKTGAFLMPIIEQLLFDKQNQYALIMLPTRELALQVSDEFRSMTKGLGLYNACFIGGTNVNKDIHSLRRKNHVVIGTPGRLVDLNQRGALNLKKFEVLVLDEFDRMLDMGFARDVNHIVDRMYHRTQTMLFSATIDKSQQATIDKILDDPVVVKVSNGESTGDQIDQDIVKLKPGEDKFSVLMDLLGQDDFKKVLVFDETKHRVRRLSEKLNRAGIKSDEIQGNKSQSARQKALRAFKQGRIDVLVATDVAARGIDVSDVTHVINYQIPMTYDSYIHRIGRTGRAGQVGKALTFVS